LLAIVKDDVEAPQRDGDIEVYNTLNILGVDATKVLNIWNEVIGGKTRLKVSNNSSAPIKIYSNNTEILNMGSGIVGVSTVWWSNYQLVKSTVNILSSGYADVNRQTVLIHEMGHTVGFAGHCNDGGVMNSYYTGSSAITSTVRNVIFGLYSLPIGFVLNKGQFVSPNGSMTIILRR